MRTEIQPGKYLLAQVWHRKNEKTIIRCFDYICVGCLTTLNLAVSVSSVSLEEANVKVTVKFSLEQATKTRRGFRGIYLLFL